MERWWCMDCKTPVTLDKHGRCDVCESEAVDLIERIQAPVNRNLSMALTVTNALQSS
jgi:Zn finger protein HypA/HybF involved in hydrogenase expression